jgi:hypothetical protein
VSRVPDYLLFLAAVALLAAPVLADPAPVASPAGEALEAFSGWTSLIKEGDACCSLRVDDRPRFLDQLTRYADALGRLEKTAADPAIAKARRDLAKEVVSADRESLFSPHVLERLFRRQSQIQDALKAEAQKDLPAAAVEKETTDRMERLKQTLLER